MGKMIVANLGFSVPEAKSKAAFSLTRDAQDDATSMCNEKREDIDATIMKKMNAITDKAGS